MKSFAINNACAWYQESHIKELLRLCRISAKSHVFSLAESNLTSVAEAVTNGSLEANAQGFWQLDECNRFTIVNELMRKHSKHTCCLFVPMPNLSVTASMSEEDSLAFIKNLHILSNGLPPTMLVHGAQQVITNEL